jgi:membrane fusion protein, multidrug efflux system
MASAEESLAGRWLKPIFVVVVVAGLGTGGWFFASRDDSDAARAAVQPNRQEQAVPVLAATAEAKDFPIIVRGIGTVEAFNTVTVKSRVNGNIEKIGYHEGQYVRQGDLLVQIDPRPYQAQLEQAEAN